jgi:hypothetical protein
VPKYRIKSSSPDDTMSKWFETEWTEMLLLTAFKRHIMEYAIHTAGNANLPAFEMYHVILSERESSIPMNLPSEHGVKNLKANDDDYNDHSIVRLA